MTSQNVATLRNPSHRHAVVRAFVLTMVMLGLLAMHRPVHAQVYPCSGPGPGEVMVGEQPASNGVAAIPLCQRVDQGNGAPSAPAYSGPPPGTFGAFVVDDATGWYTTVYGQQSSDNAATAGMLTCRAQAKQSCRLIVAFDGTASVVSDWDGKFYTATGSYAGVDAVRKALEKCNKQTTRGGCTMLAPPIIYGAVASPESLASFEVQELLFGKNWSKDMNRMDWVQAGALGSDLNALSARLDTRTYWGAVASNGNNIQTSYNQPDQNGAESVALEHCDGCKVVQVFKNTCTGIAWPKDNRPFYETALDDSPEPAKQKALAQCTGKYGECEVRARCSGRQYAQANPDAPPSKPAAPAATP